MGCVEVEGFLSQSQARHNQNNTVFVYFHGHFTIYLPKLGYLGNGQSASTDNFERKYIVVQLKANTSML